MKNLAIIFFRNEFRDVHHHERRASGAFSSAGGSVAYNSCSRIYWICSGSHVSKSDRIRSLFTGTDLPSFLRGTVYFTRTVLIVSCPFRCLSSYFSQSRSSVLPQVNGGWGMNGRCIQQIAGTYEEPKFGNVS